MIDTPPAWERFLHARRLAVLGGVVVALTSLGLTVFFRLGDLINRASDDRIATALADTPISSQLLVVRAPSRTGDWKVADAIARLDSAGARAIGVAIDMSEPVAPTGTLPDVLTSSPRTVIGVTQIGNSIAWPWFLADDARRRLTNRVALTELLREPDGVVRLSRAADRGESVFADRLAVVLSGHAAAVLPTAAVHLHFARADTGWYGATSLTLDSTLILSSDALRRVTNGRTVLLGIDDGRTVPTSVGSMPPLAVIAHDVNARARIASGADVTLRDPSVVTSIVWTLAWVLVGASIAALASLTTTVLLAAVSIVAQVMLTLWIIAVTGVWLPLGTPMLGLLMAMAGAEGVGLWQARRRQRVTSLLFARFVTPALATEAWQARHLYLQGGRPAPLQLPVTVLFLDLRGFTRFSESNPAADVMQLLTDVTAACANEIAAHGGLVDDFAGDGIKADFGVPVPRRDAVDIARDAGNAVRCAQALSATIARLAPGTLGTAGTQVRIGIHSGTAVAGTIGGSARLKYTVVGDVVNVASRLQSIDLPDDAVATATCRIIVSAATMALLANSAPVSLNLGVLTLSGREQRVHAYRLLAEPIHIS